MKRKIAKLGNFVNGGKNFANSEADIEPHALPSYHTSSIYS